MSKFGPALNVLRLFDQILLDDFVLSFMADVTLVQAGMEGNTTHCHLYFKASLQLSLF
jgi:hypothetical protein